VAARAILLLTVVGLVWQDPFDVISLFCFDPVPPPLPALCMYVSN
jgi:hypothetical protein